MEGRGDSGIERTSGSCPSRLFDPSEIVGLYVHGIFEGKAGEPVIHELSEDETEPILGQSLLVSGLFCKHSGY